MLMVALIFLVAIAGLIFGILIATMLLSQDSNGTLYFYEEDKSMYLELNSAEIPKYGYVTLKIRRV